MKTFFGTTTNTNIMVSSLVFLFAISSISLAESRLLFTTNIANDFISQTCQKTPTPNLCESKLRSNPKSSGANLQTLALVMVEAVNSQAKATLRDIDNLLKSGKPELRDALNSCGSEYNAIVIGDVPQAVEGLTKGNPKFAEQGMNDAALEAQSCESDFPVGKSPLTTKNKAATDTANVAASLVRLVMTS